jgi:Domain of unknown function (DUF4440)
MAAGHRRLTDVLSVDDCFFAALSACEEASLAELLADDFTYAEALGTRLLSRCDLLAVLASGRVRFELATPRSRHVRADGRLAEVSGRADLLGRVDGVSFRGSAPFRHVYVRADGRWRLRAVHEACVWFPASPSRSHLEEHAA